MPGCRSARCKDVGQQAAGAEAEGARGSACDTPPPAVAVAVAVAATRPSPPTRGTPRSHARVNTRPSLRSGQLPTHRPGFGARGPLEEPPPRLQKGEGQQPPAAHPETSHTAVSKHEMNHVLPHVFRAGSRPATRS